MFWLNTEFICKMEKLSGKMVEAELNSTKQVYIAHVKTLWSRDEKKIKKIHGK
jgi:hypothetical protein